MTRVLCSVALAALALVAASYGVDPAVEAAEDSHAYFNSLASRSDVVVAASLRDNAQLTKYRTTPTISNPQVTYQWPNDPDPRKQDAAKVLLPSTSNSLSQSDFLWVPFDAGTESIFAVWDSYFTDDYEYAKTGLTGYKGYQLTSGPRSRRIWTEFRPWFTAEPRNGGTDLRPYGPVETSVGAYDSIQPMTGRFLLAFNTWTRYFALLTPRNDGSGWWNLSVWVADPTRGPVQLLNRTGVRANTSGRWDGWMLELNTSTDAIPAGRGQLVSYHRNFVALRGVADATPLLLRPGPGVPPQPSTGTPPRAPQNLRLVTPGP